MENPYQPTTSSPNHTHRDLEAYVNWSQVAIWIFIAISGLVSLASMVGFLFNLTTTWPETEIPTISANPWWMVGHLVRAGSTGYIAMALFNYEWSIRRIVDQTEESLHEFLSLHSKVWFRSAIALTILFIYSHFYVLVALPSVGV